MQPRLSCSLITCAMPRITRNLVTCAISVVSNSHKCTHIYLFSFSSSPFSSCLTHRHHPHTPTYPPLSLPVPQPLCLRHIPPIPTLIPIFVPSTAFTSQSFRTSRQELQGCQQVKASQLRTHRRTTFCLRCLRTYVQDKRHTKQPHAYTHRYVEVHNN